MSVYSISSIVIFTLCASGSNTGASDQTATAVPAPTVTGAEISGKVLTVRGENFSSGANVLITGEEQKAQFDSSVRLIAKKAGKKLKAGDNLQVRNPDGTTSPEFLYNQAPYEVSVAANDVVYSPTMGNTFTRCCSEDARFAVCDCLI